MERLTERDEFGNADIIGVNNEDLQINLNFDEFNKVTAALNKLAEYEDLEELGELLKLPCEFGDTVFIKMISGGYAQAEVVDFSYSHTCGFCAVVASDALGKANIPFSKFGATIFLVDPDIESKEDNLLGNETRYCYSWDGEHYFGCYATEEEALEDARSEALHKEVYIGFCVEPELTWSCIEETVIERIEDNLYEDVGENVENFVVSVEDEKNLKTRLDAAIKAWIKDRNIKPNCYQVFDGYRVTILEI